MCSDIDRLAAQLADLERRGLGNSPEAQQIRAQLRGALKDLGEFMRRVLTDRVVSFSFFTFVLTVGVKSLGGFEKFLNRKSNDRNKQRSFSISEKSKF